jgi:hypothetical protein
VQPEWEKVLEALDELVKTRTWLERRQVIESYSDALLTDAADAVLAALLKGYEEDEEATRQLRLYRDLLRRSRRHGIRAAFRKLLVPLELSEIIEGLGKTTGLATELPEDVSNLAALTDVWTLDQISRERQPELWAAMQFIQGLTAEQRDDPLTCPPKTGPATMRVLTSVDLPP